jgi:hypothetical protein
MFRQLAIATGFAALLLVATPTPTAEAGRRGDALAASAKSVRKDYKQDAKSAESTFNTAVGLLEKGLTRGATTADQAANGFGNALAFYASQLKIAGDTAADAFATDVVGEMADAGDDDLEGGVSGDGGSADKFAESIRSDLSKLRARARKRGLRFANTLAKHGGSRVRMRIAFEAWPFSQRPAATGGGTLAVRPEPPRLWGAVATLLTDGRVIMTVFGSADPTLDENFDVRLEGTLVRALGTFVSEHGMDVSTDGTWSFTGEVGNPFTDGGLDQGNRQMHFGLDPVDQELGGRQPTRLEHAGLISIP